MEISEFTYGGVQLRYNPETGECWRAFQNGVWKLLLPAKSRYTHLWAGGKDRYIHRIIAEVFLNGGKPLTRQQDVDHIKQVDGSHAQDRLSNLRIVSRSQNLKNQAVRSTNTSGYKGVSFYKPTNRWAARITSCGRAKHLGYFSTPEAAALAYDKAAKELHGEFAQLNFNSMENL